MYQHILVSTDGSTLANKAVAEGVKLASALGSHLTFLTVFVPFASLADHDHAFAGMLESVRRQALAYLEAEGREALATASSVAKSAGVVADTLWGERSPA
jgi:nucleotide-binding universal stress UspA family protein